MGCDGELWIPPSYYVQMSTIILTFRTSEGFVIASDGRKSGPEDGHILSDVAQKIFPLKDRGIHLAYALAGTLHLGEVLAGQAGDRVIFDFSVETATATNVLASSKPSSWWNFVSDLTKSISRSLDRARSGSTYSLDKESETIVFVGGFYGKHLKSAHIKFRHGLRTSEAEPFLHPPGFNAPHGSGKIFELIDNGDPRFAKYRNPRRDSVVTLSAAIERALNDIHAHCDPEALQIDKETCQGIGGRIQIATITPADGFKWVPGFEPEPTISRP